MFINNLDAILIVFSFFFSGFVTSRSMIPGMSFIDFYSLANFLFTILLSKKNFANKFNSFFGDTFPILIVLFFWCVKFLEINTLMILLVFLDQLHCILF